MLKGLLNMMLRDPLGIPIYAWGKMFSRWLSHKKNIEIGGKLIIKGQPIIDIKKDCKLCIGDRVTLHSRNKGYHINMHSPVKLVADGSGAIIRIGEKTRIYGTCIRAGQSVDIGSKCLIAANCQIFDTNGHDLSFPDVDNRINTGGGSKPIEIGDSVWIGATSIILPGVTIGKGTIISANSVVAKDIPPMVIAGGNPAVIIKDYSHKDNQND